MKVGDVIDSTYELTRLLGEGEFGPTFEAVEKRLGRKVVLKGLPRLEADADVVDQLLHEVQVIGGSGSEFIATVIAAGRAEGEVPYLVMELIEGVELSALIRREKRPLEPRRAVALGLQVCRGVSAAHQRGILHLGLRPEKLFLTRRAGGAERLKILDFGIARLRDLRSGRAAASASPGEGPQGGPPHYSAPELLQETLEVDHRADIYSTGVILYELLTGKVPFQAESFDDLVVLIATTNPRPPRRLRPSLSEDLERVVLRAIAREADHRFSNMAELITALTPFAGAAAEAPDQAPATQDAAEPVDTALAPADAPAVVAAPVVAPAPSPPPSVSPAVVASLAGALAGMAPPAGAFAPAPAPAPAAGGEKPPWVKPAPFRDVAAREQPRRVGSPALPVEPPPAAAPAQDAVAPPPRVGTPVPRAPVEDPAAGEPARAPAMASPQPAAAEPAPPPRVERPPFAPAAPPIAADAGEEPAAVEPPLVVARPEPAPEAPAQPKPEPRLRASELAVMTAPAPGAGRKLAPQEPPPRPRRKLSRLLVPVLVLGVLLGSAAAVGWFYLHNRATRGGGRAASTDSARPVPAKRPPATPVGPQVSEPPPGDTRPAEPPPPQASEPVLENPWVAIARTDAAALLLGVSSDRLPAAVRGFRPASAVKAPSYSFELQQHEVTWGELRTWLARRPELAVGPPPAWVPETGASSFPATGVTWGTARDYCESLGGALPTEPEWELAARGERRRPFPWGAATIDLARTHAFRPGAPLSKVMANPQDVTPGSPEQALHDMAGNALEWTADLYRGDEPGRDDLPAQREDLVFRAVRGLPPAAEPPVHIQAEGAAYRDAGCAEGDCSAFGAASLQYVGFRCVRRPATASVEPAPPPPVAAPPDAGPAQTEPQTPPIKRTGPRGPGRGPIAPNPY